MLAGNLQTVGVPNVTNSGRGLVTGILATFVEYVIGALNNINSTIDRSTA